MKAETVTEVAKEVEHLSRLGASRFQHGKTQKALEAYRQAYLRSQLLGHNGYMQRACAFNLGSMLISTGNLTEGLIYLKHAEPPKGHHDGKSNGDLYFNSGLAYEGLQNMEETKHYYSKALIEYQAEHSVSMEADVLARLGKVFLICRQFNEAASCLKQLIQAHEKLGDYTKQLQSQAEQASLLLQMDQVADAESVADSCFMKCQDEELSSSIANVLIELSLTYTQMRSYGKALQCCQSALPVAGSKDADLKQIAVLYQNLGVIHSYLGQYQNAMEHHNRAASKYAELNNRKSQGHCFINLGYACSQLGDIDRAGEYFQHSLQAAKDCGDRKSEWQSLEALGSVAYHHGNIKQSQQYYRAALTLVAKSPDAEDTVVQDRILEKLTSLVHLEGHKPYDESVRDHKPYDEPVRDHKPYDEPVRDHKPYDELVRDHKPYEPVRDHKPYDEPVSLTRQKEDIHSTSSVVEDNSALVKVRSKEGGVLALKKGAKIKYLRVRRSGTLLKFNKVAQGLDSSMSPLPTARQISLGLDLDDDVFSASTISISDIEESSEELIHDQERSHANQTRHSKRVLTSYSEEDEEEDDETESEEDEERKQVLDAMRDVVSYEDEKAMSLQTGLVGGKINPRQALMNHRDTLSDKDQSDEDTLSEQHSRSENETTSDGDQHPGASNSIESTDDEDEEEDESEKNDVPPKIPTMLPESAKPGPSRTYEVPVNAAEHKPSAGRSQDLTRMSANKGQRISSSMKVGRDDSGINFFHPEELGTEDKIYESIRLPTLQEHNFKDADSNSESDYETESESELTAHERLPKGERDKIEYKAFHADLNARRAVEAETNDTVVPKKSSRVCILM